MRSLTNAELAELIKRDSRLRFLLILALPVGGALMWRVLDRIEILLAALVVAAIELALRGLQSIWLRWGRHLLVLDYFTMFMDVLAITLGLHYLGGVEFPFDWVYAVLLASVSIARGMGTGLVVAQWCILAYGGLLWAEYSGALPHMALFPIFVASPLYNNSQYVIAKLISNAAIFNLAALNAAFFSAALQQKVEERTRELWQTQAQLLHSQKLANLGQLAASLVHGFASPVTGIRGSAELLLEELPTESSSYRRVEQILHWSDHLAHILERLRNLARPPEEVRKPVDINQVVRDVLELVEKLLSQSRVVVQEQLAPDLPLVVGAAPQLEELVMNLVMNARDAMPEGGTLTVITSREDGFVRLVVRDTGVGMTPEVQRHLFEPFFTTKGKQGSGLGLNICRQIVVDHGGRISLQSADGQGTTFTVDLPLRGEEWRRLAR